MLTGNELSESGINWTELKGEQKRTYYFPGNVSVTFENVVRIEIRQSGKHRIETAEGGKAFVSPGWLWLTIEAKEWTC